MVHVIEKIRTFGVADIDWIAQFEMQINAASRRGERLIVILPIEKSKIVGLFK